jgi:thymidylate kinase
MIIECAGLPGAGKTTICGLVSVPHGKKGAVSVSAVRLHPRFLKAAWNILLLCLSVRPFTWRQLRRGFNMAIFLRHYEHRKLTILLDQGSIQKLWSLLAEAESWSASRLDRVLHLLRPFAPDILVWVEAPAGLAAVRITGRQHGNSRYEQLPQSSAEGLLAARSQLLRDLAVRFHKITGTPLVKLDARDAPTTNAAQIDILFRKDL